MLVNTEWILWKHALTFILMFNIWQILLLSFWALDEKTELRPSSCQRIKCGAGAGRRLVEISTKIEIRGKRLTTAQKREWDWLAPLTLGKKAKEGFFSPKKRLKYFFKNTSWLTGFWSVKCGAKAFWLVRLQGLYCGWSVGWWMCTLTTS